MLVLVGVGRTCRQRLDGRLGGRTDGSVGVQADGRRRWFGIALQRAIYERQLLRSSKRRRSSSPSTDSSDRSDSSGDDC